MLPLAFRRSLLGLDHSDERTPRLIERLSQLKNRGERRLLLAQFKDADISTPQVSLEPEFFLPQARLLP